MAGSQILLIIKAPDERQAKLFARERKVFLRDICPGDLGCFRARTGISNIVPVQKWFSEPGECLEKTGYPAGTLLYFNVEP
jgi:hypothetical protein